LDIVKFFHIIFFFCREQVYIHLNIQLNTIIQGRKKKLIVSVTYFLKKTFTSKELFKDGTVSRKEILGLQQLQSTPSSTQFIASWMFLEL